MNLQEFERLDDFDILFNWQPYHQPMINQFLNDERDGCNFPNFDFENSQQEGYLQSIENQENFEEEIARRAEQKKRPE